jgi:hypothetical protein
MCAVRTAEVRVAVAVVIALALAGCGQRADPKTEYRAHGLTVELPPRWHAAATNLTPNLGDPREVLAVGTFPLRYRPHDCAQVPVSALADLGRRNAFVELEERGIDPHGLWTEFLPRPRHFGPGLGGRSEGADCVPKARLSEHWFAFTDRGRHFYGRVAFGPAASGSTRKQAWEILDSLRVDAGARPGWKAVG